jgi:hypothetical protein
MPREFDDAHLRQLLAEGVSQREIGSVIQLKSDR